MATIDEQFTALATVMAQECNKIRAENGPHSGLDTTAKDTLVEAINEVYAMGGGGPGASEIDDTVTALDSTWSSSKIQDELDAIPAGGGAIDDSVIATTSTWSSNKTRGEIDSAIAAIPPAAVIDDGAPSTTKVWSSTKTNTAIGAAVAGVSKASIGLGSVDNTPDSSKPVSTAQAAADAATLASANAYTNNAVTGLYDDRGNYNASTNLYPAAGGSGAAGAILKGDIWTISVGGTLGGTAVDPGQLLRALVDAPGQTSASWAVMGSNFQITQTITNGATGTAPSSDAVFDALALKEGAIPTGTAGEYIGGDKALHALSKTAVGLANVDNTTDANKPVSTAQAAADTATLNAAKAYADGLTGAALAILDESTQITAGASSIAFVGALVQAAAVGSAVTVTINTPTSAQVGLGNVDNTPDATKPVSGPQATAIAAKEPVITAGNASYFWKGDKTWAAIDKSTVGLSNADNTADTAKPVSTAQAAADAAMLATANAYTDGKVVGLWDDRGNYNASVNTFPASGGSGAAGAVLKGDIWTISVAGTLGGTPVVAQQTVRAIVDTPGQTAGNWAISATGGTVVDAITDGVTNQAPSMNAVFDALALKENSITAGSTAQYLRGDKSLATFAADVRSAVLTGLSLASSAVIAATDSVMGALGKLQGQITDLAAAAVTLTGVATLTNKTLTTPTINGFIEGGKQGGTASVLAIGLNDTKAELTTNANSTVTFNSAPAAGRSGTILIKLGNGTHTTTFTLGAGGAIKFVGGTQPSSTAITGKWDLYTWMCDEAATCYIIGDGGRNI